jgi:outer membrane protein OmpA-like peptidoglycan-associated protein
MTRITMNHSKKALFALCGALSFLLACGAALPPKELVDARAEYQKAANGEANRADPAQVHEAKESLDDAERAFNDDANSPETKDKAYVALRKAQLAEAKAAALVAEKDRDKAQHDLQQLQLQLGLKTQAELEKTRQQLLQEQSHAAMTQQQLEQERQARIEAEKRAKEALENLARMATVKQETRGMVITLSGSVLFASNQWELLPAAMASLDNVVTALKSAPDRNITIEGHTDSQGQRAYNMDLSQRRAESVRSYLVSHGLPPEIVRAQGLGPDRPVAENSTAEGRANNRRVEIIVSPAERK